jgi:hypothetical protein
MTETTAAAAPAMWISRQEAAKRLKVSERQVERLVARGAIAKRRLAKEPWQKTPTLLYSAADVKRFLEGERNSSANPLPARPGPNGGELAGILATMARASGEQRLKPWLSLREAAEYSGLPMAFLAHAAETGRIDAVNVSLGEKQKRWFFVRKALREPLGK